MRLTALLLALLVVGQQDATALNPTFSLRAVSINGSPVIGDGLDHVVARPGDEVTCEIFIRNWSPDGERMRAIQGEIDHITYTSGESGAVQPCGWRQTTLQGQKNTNHARIDMTHPRFIYRGEQIVPLTPSHNPDYMFISVLISGDGPLCPQNSLNYYIGTLDLCISDDAQGTFTIDFVKGDQHTTMRTTAQMPIGPVETENLKIEVGDKDRPIWISESEPGFQAVDARDPQSTGARGWDRFQLVMNDSAGSVEGANFVVTDESESPPQVKDVKVDGRRVTVILDRPIAPDGWTKLTHQPSGSFTRVGRFFGDVDADTMHGPKDIRLLTSVLNGRENLPPYRSDINGDGQVDARDMLALIRFD